MPSGRPSPRSCRRLKPGSPDGRRSPSGRCQRGSSRAGFDGPKGRVGEGKLEDQREAENFFFFFGRTLLPDAPLRGEAVWSRASRSAMDTAIRRTWLIRIATGRAALRGKTGSGSVTVAPSPGKAAGPGRLGAQRPRGRGGASCGLVYLRPPSRQRHMPILQARFLPSSVRVRAPHQGVEVGQRLDLAAERGRSFRMPDALGRAVGRPSSCRHHPFHRAVGVRPKESARLYVDLRERSAGAGDRQGPWLGARASMDCTRPSRTSKAHRHRRGGRSRSKGMSGVGDR